MAKIPVQEVVVLHQALEEVVAYFQNNQTAVNYSKHLAEEEQKH